MPYTFLWRSPYIFYGNASWTWTYYSVMARSKIGCNTSSYTIVNNLSGNQPYGISFRNYKNYGYASNTKCQFILFTNRMSDWISIFIFTLKFKQKCQGCKLDLCQWSSILQPPHDLIMAWLECQPFVNTAGDLSTPWKPSHVHYHLAVGCICVTNNTLFRHHW